MNNLKGKVFAVDGEFYGNAINESIKSFSELADFELTDKKVSIFSKCDLTESVIFHEMMNFSLQYVVHGDN